MGSAQIAVGVFISSITENQVIAAVISFILLFLSNMMEGISGFFSSEAIRSFLSVFDLSSRLDPFLNGILDLQGILYFLSVIGIFLFFTVQSVKKHRIGNGKRWVKQGSYSSFYTVLAIGLIAAVNLAASRIPSGIAQIDVSTQKLYTIGDETKNLVTNLDQ